jgi:16S rRNA (cytosine967-C5)-methyltransferase
MIAEGSTLTRAPPLADALAVAAAAWLRLRSGQSLDRALQESLHHWQERAPARAGGAGSLSGAARDLASATVRRGAIVEYLLDTLSHRPPDPEVGALVMVALAQLIARSYTDFTVVDQAVRAARAGARTAAAAGLVNALLRQFLRKRAELEAQAAQDPARRYNVPPWWLRRVESEYGARALPMLAAQLEEPPLVLRVNVRRATVPGVLANLADAGMDASAVGASAVWLRKAVPVERIPGFSAGLVSVQDAGAQLAAVLLDASDDMRILDACAAPGGKTAHLLERGECRVDAIERDAERAARIGANLQRLGLAGARARVVVADVMQTQTYWDGTPYDRILLDAPCTASGVVRRHPDVLWLRRSSDVAKLATQQAKMLQTLWPLLAPAGRLLYVVCSVFAEEGRRQIAAFLRREPRARQIRLAWGDAAGLQLLPTPAVRESPVPADLSGSALPALHDGFYYALLEKT